MFEHLYKSLPKRFTFLFFLAIIAQTFIIIALKDMAMIQKLLEVQTTPSPLKFKKIMLTWTEEDLEAFRNHFYVDLFVYPITYTLFCISWLGLEVQKTTNNGPVNYIFRFGTVAFIFGGTFDIIENCIHYNSINNFKNISDAHISLAAYFSMAKWFIMITGLYAMLISYLRRTFCGKRQTKQD
jgi:hypothetical protein